MAGLQEDPDRALAHRLNGLGHQWWQRLGKWQTEGAAAEVKQLRHASQFELDAVIVVGGLPVSCSGVRRQRQDGGICACMHAGNHGWLRRRLPLCVSLIGMVSDMHDRLICACTNFNFTKSAKNWRDS